MSPSQTCLLQDCVRFLKAIHRYLREENGCDAKGTPSASSLDSEGTEGRQSTGHGLSWEEKAEEGERTYLNVMLGNPFVDARATLATQAECLLERIEKELTVAELVEAVTPETEQEEASYLDMSGSNTPKANISSSSASIDDGSKEPPVERSNAKADDALHVVEDENSYELTTDQILYDECQQDIETDPPPASPSPRTPTPESAAGESQCPFGGLPASHLRLQQSPKHGTLFKQEKRLFFDQFKKYYVGLIGKWLLLYNSHNDLKPWQTIYIKAIKLDLNLNEHINEKHLFQIITHTDSKVHFLSPSFQDLNEWIVAIESNLIESKLAERSQNDGTVAVPTVRKLPLPPCPAPGSGGDETDRLATHPGQEDGIYEEPALYLKPDSGTVPPAQAFGYDIPKPSTPAEHASPGVGKPQSVKTLEPAPVVSATSSAPPATPVKSWLKNKFNRSPNEPCEGKPSKKALKKLSFEELSLPEAPGEPKTPTKQLPPSPKFSLATTPSNKGTKINMIISQLEANGQLNLLSKRLTETNKRYTWVADDVAG